MWQRVRKMVNVVVVVVVSVVFAWNLIRWYIMEKLCFLSSHQEIAWKGAIHRVGEYNCLCVFGFEYGILWIWFEVPM